jgi:hypothetical protein
MIGGLFGHPAALDPTRDARRATGTPALARGAQHPRADHPFPPLMTRQT